MTTKSNRALSPQEVLQFVFTGSLPLDIEPTINIQDWKLLEVSFDIENVHPSYHLIGSVTEDDGQSFTRISSPVRRIDLVGRNAQTRSERVYFLEGMPQKDVFDGSNALWSRWVEGNKVSSYNDVTGIVFQRMFEEDRRVADGKEGRIIRIDDAGVAQFFDPSGVAATPDNPLA